MLKAKYHSSQNKIDEPKSSELKKLNNFDTECIPFRKPSEGAL